MVVKNDRLLKKNGHIVNRGNKYFVGYPKMESNIALDERSLDTFTKLLFILSRRDCLTLFILAKDGLDSRASTPEKIGFTKKKYYTRLHQLVKSGLIIVSKHKRNLYTHTTLGGIIFENHVAPIMSQVKNIHNLMMIDALRNSDKFTEEQIEKFIATIFEKLDINVLAQKSPKVELILSEKDIDPAIIRFIQKAQDEILVATRTHMKSLWQHVLQRAVAGARINLMIDKDLQTILGNKVENVLLDDYASMHKKDSDRQEYLQLHENVSARSTKIPMEILLLDGKALIIGLIDRGNPEKFNAAIIIEEDPILFREVARYFKSLWDSSEELPRVNLVEKAPWNTRN